MHAAVRPYATAGVALVGAGIIAVTPVAPPPPDIHIPTLHAEVALTQFVDPLTNLVQVIQTSVANATALGAITAANPTPILTQIGRNQAANAAAIAAGIQNSITDLTNGLMQLPTQLQGVLTDLSSGDIFDAVQQLLFEIPLGLALGPVFDITNPLATAASQTTQNLANAVSVLSNNILVAGLGVLEPIFSVVNQIGITAQSVFTAVTTGDLVTAASALINAPIDLVGAFLNGTPTEGGQGLLTPEVFGTLASLYSVAQAIAASLTGTPPATASAPAAAQPTAGATAAPNAAAKTVTVTTAPLANAPAPAAPPPTTPATATSAPAVKLLTPANSASVTTEAPKVSSGPVNKPLTASNTPPTATAPTTPTAQGNKVAHVSKVAAGVTRRSTHPPTHGK